MRQTKVDPVDSARAIVHNCLAREFGRMISAEGSRRTLPRGLRNKHFLNTTCGIVLLLGGLAVVAGVVSFLTP